LERTIVSEKDCMTIHRKVGFLLGVGIAFVPIIFSFFLLRPGYSYLARAIAFSWLAFVVHSALTEDFDKNPDSNTAAAISESPGASIKPEEPVKAKEAIIRHDAIFKISREGSPRTYKLWGAPAIDRINALFEPAAKIIAQTSECEELTTIELSNERSNPNNKEIVLFADCVDSKKEYTRFYISEFEINSGTPPSSEKSLAAKVQTKPYVSDCYTRLKSRATFPSTFDAHAMGTRKSVSHVDSRQVEIVIPFEAKNSLGAMLPYSGRCSYNGETLTDVEITPR
jgi:hypothetical protein